MNHYLLHYKISRGGAGRCDRVVAAQQPPPPARPPSQPEIGLVIRDDPGAQTRYAVPDLLALSPIARHRSGADHRAGAVGRPELRARVLHDSARHVSKRTAASSVDTVPYERWRELGADNVVIGSVHKIATGIRVELRLYNVRAQQVILPKEYTGSAANPRLYAHTMADEIHQTQRDLRGVARTKLAFVSDRNREPVAATVEKRDVKEVYISDYDGANQRRITINRNLNINHNWSPDGRSIAYSSYRTGVPDILISNIYAGTMENPTKGVGQNFLPMFSPDGTRIAFMSMRDGNSEIYVMNRDGSDIRRLTNNPAIDGSPTWSPTGTQIAFTSERTGAPQIYVMNVDGSGCGASPSESYADRATWSPAPYNEIAFSARTGPGFDIKILSIANGETRQITFGEGTNESPVWAPNGRHLAFMSTRQGRSQVFTVDRDGRNLRQITRDGNNTTPHWSQ